MRRSTPEQTEHRAVGYLDLVDSLKTVDSTAGIDQCCREIAARLGFDNFSFIVQFPTSLVKPEMLIISDYPAAWLDRYFANGYAALDPAMLHCSTSTLPLQWRAVEAADDSIGSGVRQMLFEACEFGLCSGLSVPIHGSAGERSMLSLTLNSDDEPARNKIQNCMPLALTVASYVHEAVKRIRRPSISDNAYRPLTPREKECLLWVAEGKTTWEIAKILKIAERTVVFHLHNAVTKLEAANRPQAVARALSQHVIEPPLPGVQLKANVL